MGSKQERLPAEKKRSRLIKVNARSNPHYGKSPEERTVHDLLAESVVFLDKPSGPTCHQIDAWVKTIVENEKVGHAGTLDPGVTGVLPLGIGKATRALPVLTKAGKEYVAVMKLHKSVGEKKVFNVLQSFEGDIVQLPPVRSAVKRVRRKRTIYYLHPLEMIEKKVLFRVGCEAGTYVRTLCVDVGKKLGSGAHLEELRRTKVGKITEEDLISLHDLKDAMVFWQEDKDDTDLLRILKPWETILHPLPSIIIRDSAVDAVCHGADLAIPGVVEIDTDIMKGDMVAIKTLKGEGAAVGSAVCSTEQMIQKDAGMAVSVERVFMAKGTYPSIWKKHK
jgi:H/ACA ribonucleoprotein complex subunit 4